MSVDTPFGPGLEPERLREDLWLVPVPVPYSRIGYTLMHVALTGRGVYLIDPGPDCPQTHAALTAGLARFGAVVADVRGILVTHYHHDHYGIAPRLRRESGAWVALSAEDAAVLDRRRGGAGVAARRNWFRSAGVPEAHLDALCRSWLSTVRTRVPAPDIRLRDSQRLPVPGWDLVTMHTPGHTAGHMCFHSPDRGLLFTGDHVLPSITPNIPAHPEAGADPLEDYLTSLDTVASLSVAIALPAHRGRVESLADRVEQIRAHHRARLDEHDQAVARGMSTAWAVAESMTWSTPWAAMDLPRRRHALEETSAHLIHLGTRGRITCAGEFPVRWRSAVEVSPSTPPAERHNI